MNDADSSARLTPQAFFKAPLLPQQRKYEALRAFFLEDMPADAVARQYGYTVMSVYSLIRDFKKELAEGNPENSFSRRLDAGVRPGWIRGNATSKSLPCANSTCQYLKSE